MSLILRAIDADPTTPTKPWQRLACLLYANGTPLDDVAREVNVELKMVSEFVTSERGIVILKALVSENPERMTNIIEATVLDSLLRLVRLRDVGKTESIQLNAAGQLLDRFFPKAKANEPPKKAGSASDFTNIQDEIARLRTEVLARD